MKKWTYAIKENIVDGKTMYFVFAYWDDEIKLHEDSYSNYQLAKVFMDQLHDYSGNGIDFYAVTDEEFMTMKPIITNSLHDRLKELFA